jgi:cytoskeleton protein RodZ
VFEIGASLRDARLRQGLDFPEVEHGTKIRAKYLRAIEDEEFDVLPSETYVKGFLRSYAEYLGLDGQPYVDEYTSRHTVGDAGPEPGQTRPRRSVAARPTRRAQANVALAGLLAIALVAALVIVAWKFGSSDGGAKKPAPVRTGQAKQPAAAPVAHPRRRRVARLTLAAVGAGTFVSVHRNSPTGKLLYEGTLPAGRTRRFVGPAIWVSAGEPRNLAVHVDGNRVRLNPNRAPAILLVTPSGVATG